MKCDNKMCIYQKFYECTCTDEIDWHGICKNMVLTRITADVLNKAKFYSKTILTHNTYHFDKQSGEYVCADTDFEDYRDK